MCARAASLSCRLSARRGSAGRFGSVPRLARTIFLAMMVGFTSAQTICTNTCTYFSDGECDDGGPGAEFTGSCDIFTDCADCGPRPDRLATCPLTCGHCLSGASGLRLPSYPAEYYYKTTYYFTCSACSSVASGGEMYVYQAYTGTGLSDLTWNVYLWFDCSNGRWTRSVVPAGYSACPNRFACPGPYPTGTIIDLAWSSSPYKNAVSHRPRGHPRPHRHSPQWRTG